MIDDPREIVRLWRETAIDYDFLSSVPETNAYYASQFWNDVDFRNVQIGLEQRRAEHKDFLAAYPYSWAFQREAYEYSIDAVYQLQAIDVVAGVWHDSDDRQRNSDSFADICVRQTRQWGNSRVASPRAIPATPERPVQFVLVPFGWDNTVGLTVEGFAEHAPSFFDRPLSTSQNDLESDGGERQAYWKALAVASLVSALGCSEVLRPLAEDLLAERIPAFRGARKHLDAHTCLNRRLAFTQAVVVYSIAHEVGHHLSGDVTLIGQEEREMLADTFAYRGLWNYGGAIASVCPPDESVEAITLLSGGLFVKVLEFGRVSDEIVGEIAGKPDRLSAELSTVRLDTWRRITEQIVRGIPTLADTWERIELLFAEFEKYQSGYADFLKTAVSSSVDEATEILRDLASRNPGLDDPWLIAEAYREEARKGLL